MSMFGLGAHKASIKRRNSSRSPAARRRNSIRVALEKDSETTENKTNDEESNLQRHESCHSTKSYNRNYNETLTACKSVPLSSSSISANNNPSLPTNTSASPSKTLSSTSNIRPPSLHHRSPHLQERYHQPLTQSNSITESTSARLPGGFGRRIGGSVRVSARDPRLPPLIPPPVNIQIASPVDEVEDELESQQNIIDLFHHASGEIEQQHIPNNAQTNSARNSPQRSRVTTSEKQPVSRRSLSFSPKHKISQQNCNNPPSIEQQSIFNRMEQRYLPVIPKGSNDMEEGQQYQHHNVLEQRQSSPVVGGGTRWQQGQDPYNTRPYYAEQPTIQTFDDQFDEFVYKSKHIAHCEPSSSAMATAQVCWEEGSESAAATPPEVNIEVPSDSDSSRRPSVYSGRRRSSFQCASDNNSMNGFQGEAKASEEKGDNKNVDDPNISAEFLQLSLAKRSNSGQMSSNNQADKGTISNNLLAARPMTEHRRSSHTGLTMQRRTSQSLHYSQKGGSRRPSNLGPSRPREGAYASGYNSPKYGGVGVDSSNLLLIPNRGRSRGASLPGNMDDVNQDDIYRMRNFATSGKKVINRGDSLKATSKSILNINSAGSSVVHSRNSSIPSNCSIQSRTNTSDDVSGPCSGASSRRTSRVNSRKNSHRPRKSSKNGGDVATAEESPVIQAFRVAMLGASEVGKSALTSQFLSSDHMNTYDTVEDDVQKVVSLCVDGKESRIIFIDHKHAEMSVENQISTYNPQGFIVVYAVDDDNSVVVAEQILTYLKSEDIIENQAVILVANKTDLVRSREVSSNVGRSLAIKYGCKYIETSPGINHNVDELLVGMLAQIQLHEEKEEAEASGQSQHSGGKSGRGGGFKVMNLLEKVWKINKSNSKSCENLHVL